MIGRLSLFIATSWALFFGNVLYFQHVNGGLFVGMMLLHGFLPMIFALLFSRNEDVSFQFFPKGLTVKHFYVWLSAFVLCCTALLISAPFITANNTLLIELFQVWGIGMRSVWWSAPIVTVALSLLAGFSIWMLYAAGGEALFRVYLVEKWRSLPFLQMWIAISAVWFLWLLPIHVFNERTTPFFFVALKCFCYCATLSMIVLAFTRHTKGLALPSIFVGLIQAYGDSLLFISPDANRHFYGISGWLGIGVLFIAALIAYVFVKGEELSNVESVDARR